MACPEPDWLGGNLPLPTTSFVGRRGEVESVAAALGAARLVTLTGPGGCGKTRLAIEVARGWAGRTRERAWLVDLSSVTRAERVPDAVAAAVGLRRTRHRSGASALVARLGERPELLVLDTCEHLLAGCAELVEMLLAATSGLRILATSRRPLELAGEAVWPVPPLAAPPDGAPCNATTLRRYDAVRLFLERAAAARPGYALTAEDGPAVAEICRRLDGLPLALELAAAWMRQLPSHEIVGRLGEGLDFLGGAERGARFRHRSLRDAFDWSYALLTDREQGVFRRLAGFAGGCTLEAAVAVCPDGPVGPEHTDRSDSGGGAADLLDVLGGLVAASLLVADTDDGEPRYWMLETVRGFAREKLAEAGEADAIAARHRAFYLGFAARAARGLGGLQEVAWLRRLGAEHQNLLVALGQADQPAAAASRPGARRQANGQSASDPLARAADGRARPLSRREREVATLIADGCTNKEIAARLLVTRRTAEAHVEHIRNKLMLRSRSQIAVWADRRADRRPVDETA